ncbi:MAG: 23S rRNA (uracil(1939)-C(5))-methyltransferase RlmD [Ferruginibacter sp.]|nr:23S rRNA (uracil(1939)-C(5))-methyltransferase RlmD [Ferruginibacter sp.]
MVRKIKKRITIEAIEITDYAAQGKAIARHEGKVIFTEGAIPGDIVDLVLTKNKKDYAEARVLKLLEPSKDRQNPFCKHFGVCGGCKWQMLPYNKQLQFKQQEAEQNLLRIGKITNAIMLPIVGADEQRFYRNKLEFTFSNKRYLTNDEIGNTEIISEQNSLGYHAPRVFDKTINIFECFLMDDVNNKLRNTIREIAEQNNFSFYDIRLHTGWLRNLIIRYTTTGELMVNLCINYEDIENTKIVLDKLLEKVPEITTLLFTINPKWNDTIYDLTPQVYFGKGFVKEKLENFEFIISPKSFFQTNTKQAEKLYSITRDFAQLTGSEIVYDLYCGTGSIGIFVSPMAKKIIGVELIEDAIEDAKKNAANNKIEHAQFFAGDVIKICNNEFFETHGRPDVVITDPPRAGMHDKLVTKLLEIAAPVIVYVSCNTATMARDILLLSEKYTVEKTQPVDMFPQTHHIECVARMVLKNN